MTEVAVAEPDTLGYWIVGSIADVVIRVAGIDLEGVSELLELVCTSGVDEILELIGEV